MSASDIAYRIVPCTMPVSDIAYQARRRPDLGRPPREEEEKEEEEGEKEEVFVGLVSPYCA
eukprot:446896-Rhodomonas_salina.1